MDPLHATKGSIMRQMRSFARWQFIPAVAFFLLAVTGCGKTATVKGKVSFDDKPIPFGEIAFISGDKRVTGVIRDGEYEVKNAPIGECTVIVDTSKAALMARTNATPVPRNINPTTPEGKKALDEFKKATAGQEKTEYMPIPEIYKDPKQSGLSFTVEKGSNEKDFDLVKPKGWKPPQGGGVPGAPGQGGIRGVPGR
jgi:hypothetical protein